MKITVYKAQRLLVACEEGKEVLRCRIALGSAPIGHKYAEGDGRTPEGSYYVCTKNERSRFHLALGVSYPSLQDAQQALARGNIRPEQYAAICAAWKERRRPPWDTPLGGFIMIHGEHPEGRSGDWTAGCVALADVDMERLFALSALEDEIKILP